MSRNLTDVEYDVNMIVEEIASACDIDPSFAGDCWPSYIQNCMEHMRRCDNDEYECYLNKIRDVLMDQAIYYVLGQQIKNFNESGVE